MPTSEIPLDDLSEEARSRLNYVAELDGLGERSGFEQMEPKQGFDNIPRIGGEHR